MTRRPGGVNDQRWLSQLSLRRGCRGLQTICPAAAQEADTDNFFLVRISWDLGRPTPGCPPHNHRRICAYANWAETMATIFPQNLYLFYLDFACFLPDFTLFSLDIDDCELP